ncbi:protease modulator HflC [Dehalococcoidia bacterium]|nr:protease modulator HflC [Dehalococcoidia bacterium]MCL0059240.1 protease modulator HflC [Dehalococcoidia bacterium]MCL0072709.1 protease modulator HflC [Dehalococcoidia bacterium]MCL0072735.1 protease modulator HflC [Dehalococcoidia bacterium]MCL0087447.1 protease modulator HflC [Dehalococcoidia bacterium]
MKKLVIVIVLVLAALMVLPQVVFIIDEREQGIVIQLGEYVRTIDEPGLNFKIPFIQSVVRMERRVLEADAPPTEFITLDKERLLVDSYIRWRIVDPHLFYKAVRDEHTGRLRLNSVAISRLREELARHNLWDIIGVERIPIMDAVGRHVDEVARREFGIEVIDVRMRRVDLPTEVEEAVFARMRAERERMAKEFRAKGAQEAKKIMADADREVVVLLAQAEKESRLLRGEGDAKAAAIYAAAFEQDPEFFGFVRSLEAYEKFLVGGTTLVLGADSELFRFLQSPQPRE